MSWTMWHINGIGFDVANANPDSYEEFIRNHFDSLKKAKCGYADKLLAYLDDGPLEDDMAAGPIDFDAIRDLADMNSIAEPIAAIMSAETGIGFDHPCCTDEGEEYVLFMETYPWEYNEVERKLTAESLYEIMRKYADELGVKFERNVDLVYAE